MEFDVQLRDGSGAFLASVQEHVSLVLHPRINAPGEDAVLTVAVVREPEADTGPTVLLYDMGVYDQPGTVYGPLTPKSPATAGWIETLPRNARLLVRRWSDSAGSWVPQWYGIWCGYQARWTGDGVEGYELRFRDFLSVLEGRPYRPANFTPNATPAFTPDTWTGAYADAVTYAVLDRAFAVPFDLPGVSVAAAANAGNVLDWRADFEKDVLTHVQEIARAGGLDIGVVPAVDGTVRYEARWLWGADRTQGNAGGNAPVLLTVDQATLGPGSYEEDWRGLANYVISHGENDLHDGLAVVVQDSASQVEYGLWPADVAVSGGVGQLQSEGAAALAEAGLQRAYSFPIPGGGQYEYGEDYDIGDLVTAVLPVRGGLTVSAQVIGADITIQGTSVEAVAVLGSDSGAIAQWRDRLRRISRRVKAAENRGL